MNDKRKKTDLEKLNHAHEKAMIRLSKDLRLSDGTKHMLRFYTGLFLHYYAHASLEEMGVKEKYWDNAPTMPSKSLADKN